MASSVSVTSIPSGATWYAHAFSRDVSPREQEIQAAVVRDGEGDRFKLLIHLALAFAQAVKVGVRKTMIFYALGVLCISRAGASVP